MQVLRQQLEALQGAEKHTRQQNYLAVLVAQLCHYCQSEFLGITAARRIRLRLARHLPSGYKYRGRMGLGFRVQGFSKL